MRGKSEKREVLFVKACKKSCMDAMKPTTLKYMLVLLMFVNWLFCFYIFWEKFSHDYSAKPKETK